MTDMIEPRLVWPVEATLGEGPAWIGRENALWFVDIKGGKVHRYDPASDDRQSFEVGGMPSFIVPAEGGKLLVGSVDGLYLLEDGTLTGPVAKIDMPAHNRTNDATVDASGRLWLGTMDNEEEANTGAIHVFDVTDLRAVGGECVITNGPAVSGDGNTIYHVDTLGRTIYRCDISGGTSLAHGEVFVKIAEADGHPDGVTVDSEGCVWVGLWGGWQARRYAPDGTLIATVPMPCANVTKVTFGGPDLSTGYVTTARKGLSEAELNGQPLAGGLFAFDAPAPGVPLSEVKLSA
ncbi:SMP-30/gluconolactonase/LRE family protein [Sphingomonas sp. H39-1-10]|uniref:SMP-30/gluconolactonase/LRE family protein n=1 Tax=Sphingomonas pollutisoli TaxID=3030829 RepID=UPI0023BA1727|nr:SMP-30/gluconolactonase/LRE family protein [Sphingomonas pollutisoli]MDF0486825.1 SMP-30/gluconolactonase/LRE family protein [Sphingomonas pollutisoli]